LTDATNDCAGESLDQMGLITFMTILIVVFSIVVHQTVYYLFKTEVEKEEIVSEKVKEGEI